MAGLLMAVGALNLVMAQILEDQRNLFGAGIMTGIGICVGGTGVTLFIFNA